MMSRGIVVSSASKKVRLPLRTASANERADVRHVHLHGRGSRTGRLSLVVMLSAICIGLTGCATVAPYSLADASAPVPPRFAQGEKVHVKRCRPLLFGLFFLAPPYRMQDLVDEATGSADAVIRVTVDMSSRWWLIGMTFCHELHGTRVSFASVNAEPANARLEAESSGAPDGVSVLSPRKTTQAKLGETSKAPPVPQNWPSGFPESLRRDLEKLVVPETAYRFTESLYESFDRAGTQNADELDRDARLVWWYVTQGKDAAALEEAFRKGQKAIGADKAFWQILQAGFK